MDSNFKHRRHRRAEREDDRFLPIRNILNLVFIIGAIIGVSIYFFVAQTPGTIVVLGAMVFKVAECILRFIR